MPKFISPSDPAAQWTGAMRGPAFFAYADNYLIDVKFGVIIDVEASRAIRQAEVGAAKTMIERTQQRFGLKPEYLAADTAYGSAEMLNWVVNEQKIAPHIPVIDKSKREDGTFSREDFRFDAEQNIYICPAGKMLTTTGHVSTDHAIRYMASLLDCRACPLKRKCCPNMLSASWFTRENGVTILLRLRDRPSRRITANGRYVRRVNCSRQANAGARTPVPRQAEVIPTGRSLNFSSAAALYFRVLSYREHINECGERAKGGRRRHPQGPAELARGRDASRGAGVGPRHRDGGPGAR